MILSVGALSLPLPALSTPKSARQRQNLQTGREPEPQESQPPCLNQSANDFHLQRLTSPFGASSVTTANLLLSIDKWERYCAASLEPEPILIRWLELDERLHIVPRTRAHLPIALSYPQTHRRLLAMTEH